MDSYSYDKLCQEVWLQAWCAAISGEDVEPEEARYCADECLEQFKERFLSDEKL